jgi:tRNA threonylcarbamoyladenosine biosynthesis protein TsaB
MRLADNGRMLSAVSPASTSLRLLAIETSTDILSVAVGSGAAGEALWQHTGPGAAQASATLLPVVQSLLAQAGWALPALDALVFARGPGSFTGLRTACAVAQGLAYGARGAGREGGVPVLPVDTLLALAEEARHQRALAGQAPPRVIAALLDARMDEMYVALYACGPQGLDPVPLQPPRLCAPADLGEWLQQGLPPALAPGDCLLAGNVFASYGAQFSELAGERQVALPTAAALLRLAPALLAAGQAVAAHEALPLYVRDKVAQTTAERERLRLEQLVRLSAPVSAVSPLDA